MSYTHALTQEIVARAVDLNSLGDKGNWAPGLFPVKIRGVALLVGNDIAAAGVVKVDKRPTFGSDVSRGDGDIAILNLAVAHTGGKVVYKSGIDVILNPGQQLVFEVTDVTGAADVGDLVIMYEPLWERPGNFSAMVATT